VQAIILAGGLGTRLRPISETIPKALVPVAGRPFIEYQIELFHSHGVCDLIICIGHLGHLIEEHLGDGGRFDVSIRYGYEREGLLGTAGAIKNVEPLLEDAFFVQYGDSYLPVDYREVMAYFLKRDVPGMMVVYKNHDRWDRSNVVVDGDRICVYDKSRKWPAMVYIDFGVSAFRREVFVGIPESVATDLSTVHQTLIEQRQLLAYEASHRFYEIGSPEGLQEFDSFVRSGTLHLLTREAT
jgi:N-acetyl-alpha-D-muramate 1-phosphate uridylyltransferase